MSDEVSTTLPKHSLEIAAKVLASIDGGECYKPRDVSHEDIHVAAHDLEAAVISATRPGSHIVLSPEEIAALSAHNEGCALTIEAATATDDGATYARAVAEGGDPPFTLEIRQDAARNNLAVTRKLES